MKVCFIAPTAYSYFAPEHCKFAGGAESQQVLLARHMTLNGIDVTVIVGDHGQADVEIRDGITLIKSFELFKGNRKLRFIPDMLKIRRAIGIADADIYNQRSIGFFTGQAAHFVKRFGRLFTFSIGINHNCYPDCLGELPFPMSYAYRYGIKRADAIIAQTHYQARLVKQNFGRDAAVIPNGIIIPDSARMDETDDQACEPGPERPFLWVGSFRRRKRPELFLDLAERLPDVSFTMIGGIGDDPPYFYELSRRAAALPNVDYLGFVSPDRMDRYYSRAYAFVNTSYLEGFPNTYLQSWIHGVPTLTVEFDPDGIIERNGIGGCTGDLEGLVEAVRDLIAHPERRREMSVRSSEYVVRAHNMADRGDDYIRLFRELLERKSRSSSSRSG